MFDLYAGQQRGVVYDKTGNSIDVVSESHSKMMEEFWGKIREKEKNKRSAGEISEQDLDESQPRNIENVGQEIKDITFPNREIPEKEKFSYYSYKAKSPETNEHIKQSLREFLETERRYNREKILQVKRTPFNSKLDEINEVIQEKKEKEKEMDISIILKKRLNEYLDDIEYYTGREVSQLQKRFVKEYLNDNEIKKIDRESEEYRESRAEFNRVRKNLISEWEKKTGQEWPTYDKNIIVNGKVARRVGNRYDAHHLIEVSWNGPHEWWNLHPAAFPNEHQDGIHEDGSVASQIFGSIELKYHCVPLWRPNHYRARRAYDKI